MKKRKEFDNILDECFERLLKGETVEQCLASYPEQAAELEPLLQTALVTKKATAVEPRPEFRDRARYQFRAALREMELKKGRSIFGWQPRWATAVIAVLVFLLASSGTIAAASNSMPDEPLYQVKLATEAVRLALTPSRLGKAELYASLTDKRVKEITSMADKGNPEAVEKAAQKLNAQLIAMAGLTAPQGKEAGVLRAPAPQPAPQPALQEAPPPQEAPQVAVEEAPPPTVEEEAGEKETGAIMAPAPQATERGAPKAAQRKGQQPDELAGGERGGGGERIKIDKRADLKTVLARNAVEQKEALKAALERAPESVKPALRRAIAEAEAGYEEALKSLD